jgi:Zn-dependent M28 family amino/carboxypeptidase
MEWRFTYWGGSKLVVAVIILSLASVFVSLACNIAVIVKSILNPEFAASNAVDIISYVLLGFIVIFLTASLFYDKKRIVEGANDNLTGTMASVAIMKYLEDNNIRFENTEVVALAAGSEESGLRGSRAYTKRHLDELKAIPTIFIGLETFRDYDSIAIYERDMTGTVKMDARVCALMKKAGLETGLDIPYSSVYVGASDAAAVQKLGVPAVTLAAMDPGPPRYYHTIGDTADNMDVKTVEKCLDIALNTLFIYDEQGLQDEYK